MEEKNVWRGSPSHWVNFGNYLFSVLFLALFVAIWVLAGKDIRSAGDFLFYAAIVVTLMPLAYIGIKWWQLKSLVYDVTSERIRIQSGILNKKTSTMELYRVKDYMLREPFFYRMLSLGSIDLITSDPTNPRLSIRAIKKPKELLDQIRTHVEECRVRKGVRQLDVDSLNDLPSQS